MVEMKRTPAEQDIQVILDIYNEEDCRSIALAAKDKAFSVVQSVKALFTKKGQAVITHSEKRYEPFWHICAESYLEYTRLTSYSFEVNPEVRSVTFNGRTLEISGADPVCRFQAEDLCVEQYSRELTRDAVANKESGLSKYLGHPTRSIEATEELMGPDVVVVPARIKASYLVRELFKELLKPIHADEVIEEKIEVGSIILFFRPLYAFEFCNQATGQYGALEVDALTGEAAKGKVFKTELDELISEDVLFDLGAELAETVIPGVGLGVAIGKRIKASRDKKKKAEAMEKSAKALAARKKKS